MQENQSYQEKQLLIQVAASGELAFRKLYDLYRQRIYSLGMHLTRSEVLAEEIVQDVFMKIWEQRSQLTEISYFNAWLRTIARNTCSNYLRSMAAERLGLQKIAANLHGRILVTENDAADREYDQILQAAIKKLPSQQQKVYLLSRQQGLKNEEIAQKLNISIYTVKEYMKLALRSIRTHLQDHIDITLMLALALYLN